MVQVNPNNKTYNICMFAYNEEKNIRASIENVFAQPLDNLDTFYVIANGCTDNTVSLAKALKIEGKLDKLQVVELQVGDKCNAWNFYMRELSTKHEVECHFFVDADVKFSSNAFEKMAAHLINADESYVAIAGLPQSGRNKDYYRELVTERSCLFGNLYGLRNTFIKRINELGFFLPKGLNWIDSFITKAVNTNLDFKKRNLPNRVTYLDECGYYFEHLSPFSLSDIKLYKNRIARYELGKIQERLLDEIKVENWPENMDQINQDITDNFNNLTAKLGFVKKVLVKKRLRKALSKSYDSRIAG